MTSLKSILRANVRKKFTFKSLGLASFEKAGLAFGFEMSLPTKFFVGGKERKFNVLFKQVINSQYLFERACF